MATYVAFLRAVNVGKRPYPMAELRAALVEAGFADPQTHIQTGNVLVTSRRRSADAVAAELEAVFEADRGWPVRTVVFTPSELAQVLADAAEIGDPAPAYAHYVELLRTAPDAAGRELIEAQTLPGQRYVLRGRAVHLLFDVPFHVAKPPSAAVKRALGDSTNRNLKVLRALAQKWGNDA